MSSEEIQEALQHFNDLKKNFKRFESFTYEWRVKSLESLREAIKNHMKEYKETSFWDLNRSDFDSELEANVVLDNIENTIKNLKHWMKDVPVDTPILCAPAKSRLHYDPLGVTLIISAWNYPLFTLFEPLVSNIAAGNLALLKPSENSPNTSRVLKAMINDMDQDYF